MFVALAKSKRQDVAVRLQGFARETEARKKVRALRRQHWANVMIGRQASTSSPPGNMYSPLTLGVRGLSPIKCFFNLCRVVVHYQETCENPSAVFPIFSDMFFLFVVIPKQYQVCGLWR